MSLNCSSKEYYMSLYIKLNKKKLEEILNIKICNDIELEKNFNGRKVDIYSSGLENDKELYMELQLGKADNIHLNQLLHIIECEDLNNYVLIWTALEHTEILLKKIEEAIDKSHKNICFYAFSINTDLIEHLQKINEMFVNDIVDNLSILDSVNTHFSIKEIYYKLQDEKDTIPERKEVISLDLDNKQDVMKLIYKMLKEEIYYYPSIHRDKQLDRGNVISLGAGSSNTSFFIGYNRNNFLFVDLRFGESQSELFEMLLLKENEVNSDFDYMTEFNKEERKISTYFFFDRNKRELRIKQLVRMVNIYIKYFSHQLYNKEQE